MVPVNVEVAWEGYIYLGKHLPSREVYTTGIADTGFGHLNGA